MFTGVYLSTRRGVPGSRGLPGPGRAWSGESMVWGCLVRGVAWCRPPDGYCRWYVSYWNAFSFGLCSLSGCAAESSCTRKVLTWRVLSSDCFVNSFIMVVYENCFSVLWKENSDWAFKINFRKSYHYKAIYGLVRREFFAKLFELKTHLWF